MIRLLWKLNPRASVFHAAWGARSGLTPHDDQLFSAIEEPYRRVLPLLRARHIPEAFFWSLLLVHAADTDSIKSIVATAIRRLYQTGDGAMTFVDELSALIARMLQLAEAHMISMSELSTRVEPLRRQWEAYGPGLISLIANRTAGHVMVSEAKAILVQPIFGGAGEAHLDQNAIHIEAVLVNPHEELPEVVRLGWLLSQLNNDLPMYSESIPRGRLPLVSGLAMLPATLIAAEELGLAKLEPNTLAAAMGHWRLEAEHDARDLAEKVQRWWAISSSGGYAWNASLRALEAMIVTGKEV